MPGSGGTEARPPTLMKMRGIRAGHKRFGRHAAGVDAGAAEQVPLDQGHRHPGSGEAAGERRARLPGANDDRVKTPAHRNTVMMKNAASIATASSMKAAG